MPIAQGIAAGRHLPLLGPAAAGTGAFLGPLYYYVLAVPYTVSFHPLAGAVWLALLGGAALALCFRFTRRYWGASAAWTATACFATAPLAIVSARIIWNVSPLPCVTVWFISALAAWVVDRRPAGLTGALAALAVALQLHLSSLALVLLLIWAAWRWRPPVTRRHLLAGLAIVVLIWLPYLVHEARHGGANTHALLAFGARESGRSAPWPVLGVLRDALTLGWAPAVAIVGAGRPGALTLLYAACLPLYWLGMAQTVHDARRHARAERRRLAGVLLGWWVLPLALVAVKRSGVWWYYLDLLYPVQFIFIARGTQRLARERWLPVVLVALISGAASVGMAGWIDRSGRTAAVVAVAPLRFGTTDAAPVLRMVTYRHTATIAETLCDRYGLDPEDIAQRVRWPLLGLPWESQDLLSSSGVRCAPRRAADALRWEYLVAPQSAVALTSLSLRAVKTAGPYLVAAYVPAMAYDKWVYAIGAEVPAAGSPAWSPLRPRWGAAPLRAQLAPGTRLYVRHDAPSTATVLNLRLWGHPAPQRLACRTAAAALPMRRMAYARDGLSVVEAVWDIPAAVGSPVICSADGPAGLTDVEIGEGDLEARIP